MEPKFLANRLSQNLHERITSRRSSAATPSCSSSLNTEINELIQHPHVDEFVRTPPADFVESARVGDADIFATYSPGSFSTEVCQRASLALMGRKLDDGRYRMVKEMLEYIDPQSLYIVGEYAAKISDLETLSYVIRETQGYVSPSYIQASIVNGHINKDLIQFYMDEMVKNIRLGVDEINEVTFVPRMVLKQMELLRPNATIEFEMFLDSFSVMVEQDDPFDEDFEIAIGSIVSESNSTERAAIQTLIDTWHNWKSDFERVKQARIEDEIKGQYNNLAEQAIKNDNLELFIYSTRLGSEDWGNTLNHAAECSDRIYAYILKNHSEDMKEDKITAEIIMNIRKGNFKEVQQLISEIDPKKIIHLRSYFEHAAIRSAAPEMLDMIRKTLPRNDNAAKYFLSGVEISYPMAKYLIDNDLLNACAQTDLLNRLNPRIVAYYDRVRGLTATQFIRMIFEAINIGNEAALEFLLKFPLAVQYLRTPKSDHVYDHIAIAHRPVSKKTILEDLFETDDPRASQSSRGLNRKLAKSTNMTKNLLRFLPRGFLIPDSFLERVALDEVNHELYKFLLEENLSQRVTIRDASIETLSQKLLQRGYIGMSELPSIVISKRMKISRL